MLGGILKFPSYLEHSHDFDSVLLGRIFMASANLLTVPSTQSLWLTHSRGIWSRIYTAILILPTHQLNSRVMLLMIYESRLCISSMRIQSISTWSLPPMPLHQSSSWQRAFMILLPQARLRGLSGMDITRCVNIPVQIANLSIKPLGAYAGVALGI